MDDEHDPIMEYPAWRAAISQLVRDKRLNPGAVFEFAELYDLFMLKQPQPDTPMREADRAKLLFLGQFAGFEEALLTEHQVALANIRGVGYRIVPPSEQTSWAENQGIGDVRKAVKKLSNRLTNVSFDALTSHERRANADALARLGMLGGMLKQVTEFKLRPPDDE